MNLSIGSRYIGWLLFLLFISWVAFGLAVSAIDNGKLIVNWGEWPHYALSFVLYFGAQLFRLARLQYLCLEHDRKLVGIVGLFSAASLVGALLPYKTGDFVKFTLYSVHLRSISLGFTIIFIERLFDAVVLLFFFMILPAPDVVSESLSIIKLLLILFIIITASFYWGTPSSIAFLRRLVLRNSNSERGIRLLEITSVIESAHTLFGIHVRGRWLPILICSTGAWTLELLALGTLLGTAAEIELPISTLLQYFQHHFLGLDSGLYGESAAVLMTFYLVVLLSIPAMLYVFSSAVRMVFDANKKMKLTKVLYSRSITPMDADK
jgi:hypothetical protein